MKSSRKHIKYKGTRAFPLSFFLFPFSFFLLMSCAQQGSLTGGEKDTEPPKIIKSEPPNFSTHFATGKIVMTFDEYFDLRNINQKLVVSPPMDHKPEFKVKGKSLEIRLKDSLQPGRTYAINFGDALVDLNEANALKNFQFVFSTGSTIDSLQASGNVVMVPDGKPAEDVLVMLYDGTSDSLPLKEIPLYISRTDKEGKFTLKNLAAGSYRIFALKDANNNMLFDQPTEAIAFLDSLLTPGIEQNLRDSAVSVLDSTAVSAVDSLAPVIRDSTKAVASDTAKTSGKKGGKADVNQPNYRYIPDNLELRMFTETRPNQYLSGNERPRRDQVRIRLNEKTDSLDFAFTGLPADSAHLMPEWFGEADTIDFWIGNPLVAGRDSLTALVTYAIPDSTGRPVPKTDTVQFRYRPPTKTPAEAKKEFSVTASPERSKSLDPGQRLILTLSLAYAEADTARIILATGKDSVLRKVGYTLVPDTLKGLILNGSPVEQRHPRILSVAAVFLPDSSYRLHLLPGAFTSLSGLTTDSLDIRFRIKKTEDFGSVRINIPVLDQPAFVEFFGAQNKLLETRRLSGPETMTFSMLAPGKYTARLILDTNGNGKWDTGRYLKHIQPEWVIPFPKELNVKANWEVSETWEWKDPQK